MDAVEEKIEACRVARAAVEREYIKTDRAIDRIHLTPKCTWCCAQRGHPCRTRRGDVRLHPHVHRTWELTEQQRQKLARLYVRLDQLRRALA
jgi:hypothetical protein